MNLYKLLLSKINITNLIFDMKDKKEYNLTTKLIVNFIRKGKKYVKDIFIFMNATMKQNILLKENIQHLQILHMIVCPHNLTHLKLFLLLIYNKTKNKILLCMLALIYNENCETLECIFKYLKKQLFL